LVGWFYAGIGVRNFNDYVGMGTEMNYNCERCGMRETTVYILKPKLIVNGHALCYECSKTVITFNVGEWDAKYYPLMGVRKL
jgi:hypothetical protein